MNPMILVITPTLGDRISLQRTIESVHIIGGNDVKHIIIAPKNRIKALQEKYPYITFISEPEGKKGIYAALNYGFNKYGHEYEYMTFINDDDYWLPKFRKLINTVKEGHFDFVYGRTKYVDSRNKFLGEQTSSGYFSDFIPLLHSNIVLLTQQSTILRSEWYFKLKGFDESYKLVADSKFWAQLSLEKIKFKYLKCCCAAYMIQEGQLSSDHNTQTIEHKRLLNELPSMAFVRVQFSKVRYRLINWDVYLKRFFLNKRFSNPFV